MKYKEPAIIVDIDGTLAHRKVNQIGEFMRTPHEYEQVDTDTYDPIIGEIVDTFAKMVNIIIVSGRPASAKIDTVHWLNSHSVSFDAIFTRTDGDYRQDSLVKYEIYKEHIEPFYNVKFVLDDRNRVVEMWRDQGLKVLQVAEGDF